MTHDTIPTPATFPHAEDRDAAESAPESMFRLDAADAIAILTDAATKSAHRVGYRPAPSFLPSAPMVSFGLTLEPTLTTEDADARVFCGQFRASWYDGRIGATATVAAYQCDAALAALVGHVLLAYEIEAAS